MQNSEEYVLRVLRRTQLGLQDSLMPSHALKLVKLVEKFEATSALKKEIHLLKRVSGFQKCAISMEWLYNRVQNPVEEFSPEQFESDILMLNEKIFEAFLNQPFDLPDTTVSQPQSFDFSSSSEVNTENPPSLSSPFSEPNWGGANSVSSPAFTENVNASFESPIDSSPSLFESFDSALLEAAQRLSGLLSEFGLKMTNERPIAMAVIRMTAKTANENARSMNNVIAQEFFQNLVNLVNYIDQEGKIKNEDVASLMLDIGDRLRNTIDSPVSGITFLKKITEYISNPKELLKKK